MNIVYRSMMGVMLVIGWMHDPLMAQDRVVEAGQPASAENKASDALLARKISVKLDRVTLGNAIEALATSAHTHAQYRSSVVYKILKLVTLSATDIPLGVALDRVLAGTGLQVVVVDESLFSITEADSANPHSTVAGGSIRGAIVDAETKRPIAGVTVTLDGAKSGVTSEANGMFKIVGIAAGTHRIMTRRIGYQVYSTTVDVANDMTEIVNIALTVSASRLTDVVTTANGKQRRLEVGTVIAHINADSVVKAAPIMSVTDLLAGRAPSVQIVPHNGLVGSGPAIRIRGQSSLTIPGDPIIIIDGIRVDNTAGGTYFGNFGGAQTSPSRINDLDFNQIETIDILKGPAASTEYGTDAANGVIIITTKRGKPGATTWNASAHRGWSEIPTDFPDYWWAFGHNSSSSGFQCQLLDAAANYCQIDSVVHDNPLNHANTTDLGSGPNQSVHLGVGGGSSTVRYALGVSSSQQEGTLHMPNVFKPMLHALGFPSSVNDPNNQTQQDANGNFNVNLSPAMDLAISTSYLSTRQKQPIGVNLTPSSYPGPVILDSAHFYGYYYPLGMFSGTQSQLTNRAVIGVGLDWRPATWFSGHASGGSDRGSQRQLIFKPLPPVMEIPGGYNGGGVLQIVDQVTTVSSGDARGAATLPLGGLVKFTTAIGLNAAQTTTRGLNATNYNLPLTNQTLTAPGTITSQIGAAATTGGIYVDEQLNIVDRLFVTSALRMDGASGFGGDRRTTAYPKFNASWVALNTDATTVRLRAAFGVAGVQPTSGAWYQRFQSTTATVNGTSIGITELNSPGNPILRPERSHEWEGGVDVGMFQNRLNLELTGYTKNTTDELVNVGLGITFNNMTVQENLGNVRNSGIEGSLNATLLSTSNTTWSATFNASHNSNKLLKIAPGLTKDDLNGTTMQVVGYPLYGYWGRRVRYADTNGDHIITYDELTIDDTNSFLGSSLPKVELSYSTSLSLFRGKVVFNTGFDSKWGDVVANTPEVWSGGLREQNDIHSSLYEQARYVAVRNFVFSNSLDYEKGWFLAWRNLSATLNLPPRWFRWLRGRDLSVTASVANLTKWSHYTGLDPEVNDPAAFGDPSVGGLDYGDARSQTNESALPIPRTWALGINMGF